MSIHNGSANAPRISCDDLLGELNKHSYLDLVFSTHGPPASIRPVLYALTRWMYGERLSAWPSQETMAKALGRNRSTVTKALAEAERLGWVERFERRPAGQGWKRLEYDLAVPEAVWLQIQEDYEAGESMHDVETTNTGQPREASEPAHHASPDEAIQRPKRGQRGEFTEERGEKTYRRGEKTGERGAPGHTNPRTNLRKNLIKGISTARAAPITEEQKREKFWKAYQALGGLDGDLGDQAKAAGLSVEEGRQFLSEGAPSLAGVAA